MRTDRLVHSFVDVAPATLDEATLYVSLEYDAAVHLCCCGCGSKVMTPLSPDGWSLVYDGSVSLRPSIGNGSYPCRSHYWIKNNQVCWLPPVSDSEIEWARSPERHGRADATIIDASLTDASSVPPRPRSSIGRFMDWLLRRS